jgi:hypothetical protein
MAQASPLEYAPAPEKPAFDLSVWLRLSVMMFLQFAVWGAWFTVLNLYLGKTLNFTGTQIGSVYGTMALGAIFSMLVAGQLADRVMASEYLMAIFHLAGAGLLYLLSRMEGFNEFWWVAFAYALVYNPTLTVSNAIAFANIRNSTHFAWVRVFGTFGWILAGITINFRPAGRVGGDEPPDPARGRAVGRPRAVQLPAPAHPAERQAGRRAAVPQSVRAAPGPELRRVLRAQLGRHDRAGVLLQLRRHVLGRREGEQRRDVPDDRAVVGARVHAAAPVRHPVPRDEDRAGDRDGLPWVARYALFSGAADGTPFAMLVVGVALHGVCFDFFLAAGFIHTDTKAPAAIRGSAQALFSFLVYGVGMWIGNELSGRVVDANTANNVKDWARIWMVPSIGAAVCLVLFLVFWRDRAGKVDEAVPEPREFAVEPVVALNGEAGPGVAARPGRWQARWGGNTGRQWRRFRSATAEREMA